MSKPILNRPRIMPRISQRVAAGMAQHVGVHPEGHSGVRAYALNKPIDGVRSEWRRAQWQRRTRNPPVQTVSGVRYSSARELRRVPTGFPGEGPRICGFDWRRRYNHPQNCQRQSLEAGASPTNFANTVRPVTPQQAVAREFKVGKLTISDIVLGPNWSKL